MGSFRLREFRAPLGQRLRATCEQEMVGGGQQFQKQDRARHILSFNLRILYTRRGLHTSQHNIYLYQTHEIYSEAGHKQILPRNSKKQNSHVKVIRCSQSDVSVMRVMLLSYEVHEFVMRLVGWYCPVLFQRKQTDSIYRRANKQGAKTRRE